MNLDKRPISLTVLSCVYLAVGTLGFIYHFGEFQARHPFQSDAIWIELTELVAILCGAFLLRAQNWARWLAFAWIVFHVILSFHELQKFAIHGLLCAVIAWCLFRPEAGRYFRSNQIKLNTGS